VDGARPRSAERTGAPDVVMLALAAIPVRLRFVPTNSFIAIMLGSDGHTVRCAITIGEDQAAEFPRTCSLMPDNSSAVILVSVCPSAGRLRVRHPRRHAHRVAPHRDSGSADAHHRQLHHGRPMAGPGHRRPGPHHPLHRRGRAPAPPAGPKALRPVQITVSVSPSRSCWGTWPNT
jgi:hypothetical protein